MDDPNITMEEYIRLEEEKARRHGQVYNWETAKYGKIWYDKDVHNLRSFETKFPAIVINDTLTSDEALPCEPTVSPPNNTEIDFRISFDESDDEDYTVIYDENSFSYKIIYVNNLKMDSKNDSKVNMPSFPSPKPEVYIWRILGVGIRCIDHAENKIDLMCAGDVLDFRTWPDISLETSVMSTMDLNGVTCLTGRFLGLNQKAYMFNYGVTCEDEAKRRNSGTKTKTFEENCYLLLYAVSSKEDTAYQRQLITRIRVIINSRSGVSLFTYTPYAQLVISQRYEVNVIDGN
ncbi:hypothetical protein Tco_0727705 [Tanacetum coccineum]|uniref:Uncharacterized protein n=1 Tax=Tanacetum coccineum TaxID=301880 RepID=A0ABQ4YJ09_9ASTR